MIVVTKPLVFHLDHFTLAGLNVITSVSIQSWSLFRCLYRLSQSWTFLTFLLILASPADIFRYDSFPSGKALTQKKNKHGPNCQHCGTPLVTLTHQKCPSRMPASKKKLSCEGQFRLPSGCPRTHSLPTLLFFFLGQGSLYHISRNLFCMSSSVYGHAASYLSYFSFASTGPYFLWLSSAVVYRPYLLVILVCCSARFSYRIS